MFCALASRTTQNQKRATQANHDGRPDINSQKIEAGSGSKANRPEESPRRAIDCERQGVDKEPRATVATKAARAVAVARNQEQQPDVRKRNGDNDPTLQHELSRSGIGVASQRFCRPKSPQNSI